MKENLRSIDAFQMRAYAAKGVGKPCLFIRVNSMSVDVDSFLHKHFEISAIDAISGMLLVFDAVDEASYWQERMDTELNKEQYGDNIHMLIYDEKGNLL